ncbi:MAG TPA: hypothetical protein VF928_09375 [Usitatibacteraceae bacterium]
MNISGLQLERAARQGNRRSNIIAAVALVAILGGYVVAAHYDEIDRHAIAVAIADRAMTEAVQALPFADYVRVDKHCKVPMRGQVLTMRPATDPARGYECETVENVGYGRAPRVVAREYSRGE